MQTSIDLSIIIVNWNVCDLLRDCLKSILRTACPAAGRPENVWLWQGDTPFTFEVLVVDSASSDGSVLMVQHEFPLVRLLTSSTNLGYAGGNNLGIKNSRGRCLLLLNPDTEVRPGALPAMLAYMDAHANIGALGPQLFYADGSVQSSRRRFPSVQTALIESTWLQKWFPHHPVLQQYYVQDSPDDAICEVDWVTGACILTRRSVIEQVGLFDEAYFMYSEEMDWQKRIKAAGWKIVYLPTAQIVHHEGKSSEQVISFRHIRFQKSKIRYFKKHHGQWVGELIRYWLLFNYIYEWTAEALKWCVGHRRELRRERMRSYAAVLETRLRA